MSTIMASIFGVFDEISSWIIDCLGSLPSIFYSPETGLTFLGVLAVAALGFSVVFLLIGLIQRFLHFRG